MKKNYCIDCLEKGIKTEITRRAKRCGSCATKKWIREEGNPFKGKHHTKKTRRKMKQNHWSKTGTIKHPLLGKHLTEEHKEKIRQFHLNNPIDTAGEKNGNFKDGRCSKVYYCTELDCNNEISYNNWKYGNKRCRECYYKFEKGKNNGNYIHGKGYEPYTKEFNNELKERIRKRDNYECQGEGCSITQEEHFIMYGRDLEIHHIDYDKENNDSNNLVTTCKQCNIRANYNRDYWKKYFREKVIVLQKV